MKRLYWRPQKISCAVVVAIAVLSLGGLFAVETFKIVLHDPHAQSKLAAAHLAEQSMQLIKAERLRRGHVIDPEFDPAESGMIGQPMSPVTSVAGHLGAKQTSVNPNFAAAVVDMLVRAGVKEGDRVAVGCSGSFPALNIAVCAALEKMKCRPIIISSAAASQFGANMPDLLWIDMERLLHEHGFISFRSCAASIGGVEDRAERMSDEGRELIREAISRNNLTLLESESFETGIHDRMQTYLAEAGREPIKAYINVGGGAVSVGRSLGKHLYEPGLNIAAPPNATDVDSVMTRFARSDVPVIHLVDVRELADRFDFPTAPAATPLVGEGTVYGRPTYNRWVAAGLLVAILLSLRFFVLSDRAVRLSEALRRINPWRREPPLPAESAPARQLMV